MTPLPSLFVSPGAPTFALEPGRAGALLRDIGQRIEALPDVRAVQVVSSHWRTLFVFKPAGTTAFFRSLGLPDGLAYFTIAAEFAGGVALILGIWPRAAALALVPMMLRTIATVHGMAGFFFDSPKGGWEYPAFWSVSLLVLALAGDGAWALLPTQTLLQLVGL